MTVCFNTLQQLLKHWPQIIQKYLQICKTSELMEEPSLPTSWCQSETAQSQTLFLWTEKNKKIALLELTCSLPGSSDKAHNRKNIWYTQLSLDLEELGFQVFLMPFEVMSSGHIAKPCKMNLISTLRQFNIRLKSDIFVNLAKIALLCTMSVFHPYKVKEWASPPLIVGKPSRRGLSCSKTARLHKGIALYTSRTIAH